MKNLILVLLCCGLGLAAACGTAPELVGNNLSRAGEEEIDDTWDDPDPAPEVDNVEKPEPEENPKDVEKVVEPEKPVVKEIPKKAEQPEKPEALFHLIKAAFARGDYGAVFDRLSTKSVEKLNAMRAMMINSLDSLPQGIPAEKRAEIEAKALEAFGVESIDELKQMDLRDFFVSMMKVAAENGAADQLEKIEIVRVEMGENEESAVIVTKDENGKEDNVIVVLEDGKWKIGLFESTERDEIDAEDDEEDEE